MKEIIKSKKFKVASIIVGVILCALIIFSIGVSVGLHKGKFSCDWGKNYERNFLGSRENDSHKGLMPKAPEFMNNLEGHGFRNAHGLAGSILSVSNNTIVVKDKEGKENTITITENTLIKSRQSDLTLNDLKQNDEVIIMGKPNNNGMLEADLIRVMEINNANTNNGVVPYNVPINNQANNLNN